MFLRDVQRAARESETADRATRVTRARLREVCRAALAEGTPIGRVAREAHLGRREVEDLVAGH